MARQELLLGTAIELAAEMVPRLAPSWTERKKDWKHTTWTEGGSGADTNAMVG